MNHRALPILVAGLLIVAGVVATLVVRGGEFNSMIGAGIGVLVFLGAAGAVAAVR